MPSIRGSVLLLAVVAALAPAGAARPAASVREGVEAALALLPPDVEALVLVPSLDRTGDEMKACLEGMERSALLLGARPLDQVKSATGLLRAVNDLGPVAIAWSRAGSEPGAPAAACVIVPVNDPALFLDANFEADPEPGAWRHPDGRRFFARPFGAHVVLAPGAWVLAYDPAGPVGFDVSRLVPPDGDVVLVARRAAIERGLDAAAASGAVGAPTLERLRGAVAGTIPDEVLVAIDFDPLGVIIRVEMRPGRTAAPAATPGTGDRLARLARAPALAAGTIDAARLPAPADGGPPSVLRPPSALRSVTFAARPDEAGGVLGAVEVHLETANRAAVRAWVGRLLDGLARDDASVRRTVTRRPLDDERGLPSRTAFAVTTVPLVAEAALPALLESTLVGRRGLRGVIGDEDGGVLVVLGGDAAWRTAHAVPSPGAGLAADGAVRTIRGWLPAGRALEVYVDPRLVLERAAPIAPLLAPAGIVLPPVPDEALPPVGLGAALRADAAEAVVVVPAPVAALALDAITDAIVAALARSASGDDGAPAAEPAP